MSEMEWSKIKQRSEECTTELMEQEVYNKCYKTQIEKCKKDVADMKNEINSCLEREVSLKEQLERLKISYQRNVEFLSIRSKHLSAVKVKYDKELKNNEELFNTADTLLHDMKVKQNQAQEEWLQLHPNYQKYKEIQAEVAQLELKNRLLKKTVQEESEKKVMKKEIQKKINTSRIIQFVEQVKFYHESIRVSNELKEMRRKWSELLGLYKQRHMETERKKLWQVTQPPVNLNEVIRKMSMTSQATIPKAMITTTTNFLVPSLISSNKRKFKLSEEEEQQFKERNAQRAKLLKSLYSKNTMSPQIVPTKLREPSMNNIRSSGEPFIKPSQPFLRPTTTSLRTLEPKPSTSSCLIQKKKSTIIPVRESVLNETPHQNIGGTTFFKKISSSSTLSQETKKLETSQPLQSLKANTRPIQPYFSQNLSSSQEQQSSQENSQSLGSSQKSQNLQSSQFFDNTANTQPSQELQSLNNPKRQADINILGNVVVNSGVSKSKIDNPSVPKSAEDVFMHQNSNKVNFSPYFTNKTQEDSGFLQQPFGQPFGQPFECNITSEQTDGFNIFAGPQTDSLENFSFQLSPEAAQTDEYKDGGFFQF